MGILKETSVRARVCATGAGRPADGCGNRESAVGGRPKEVPGVEGCLLGEAGRDAGPRRTRGARRCAKKKDAEGFKGKKLDAIVRPLEKFEMIGQVLFRRVYNLVSNQVELRCAVPSGAAQRFEFPGRGPMPLGFREREDPFGVPQREARWAPGTRADNGYCVQGLLVAGFVRRCPDVV